MSPEVGPVAVLPADGRGPLFPGVAEISEHTRWLVDREVRRIVEGAHSEVVALLMEQRDKLEALAQALLEHETLEEAQAYEAAGVARPHEDTAEAPRRMVPTA
jgi:cell division protease FtsH